jgi:hypothetical protein
VRSGWEARRKLALATVVAVVAALTIPGRAAAAVGVTLPLDPILGQALTAQVVTDPTATGLAYQWLRCTAPASCTPIDGATTASYAVGTADVGLQLSVVVTATYADATTETGQALTAAVRAAARVTGLSIAGREIVGQTLVATATATGYPLPVPTYQWQRCRRRGCVPIPGANQPSYLIDDDDAGYSLAVQATAQNEVGADVRSLRTDVVQVPQTRPVVTKPTVVGDPQVGQRLLVDVTVTGVPTPGVSFQWLRCAGTAQETCAVINGATESFYDVVSADAGRRIAVRVRAVNSLGVDVQQSDPTPLPVPLRSGAFDQSGITVPPASGSNPTAQALSGGALFLRPFPIVRVKGRVASRGARITLFRVRAPSGSKVVVRCRRVGCPLRRRSTRPGRIRKLERYLPAGIRLTIRVTKPGLIGKYVRLVIRGGSPPKRRDACLMPGDPAPAKCPPM